MISESFSPTSMAAPSSRSFLYPLPSSPSFFQPCFMNNSPIASRVPEVGGGTITEPEYLANRQDRRQSVYWYRHQHRPKSLAGSGLHLMRHRPEMAIQRPMRRQHVQLKS